MITTGSRALVSALCTMMLLASAVAMAQDRPAHEGDRSMPAGSENAVKAALAACPGAVLEDVVTPSQSIGLGGPADEFWTLHLRVGGTLQTLNVSADGVLIKSNKAVEAKDLPSSVKQGLAKVAPKGTAGMTKLETLAVVRFVALPMPQIRYVARVTNDAGTAIVTVAPDGAVVDTQMAKGPKKAPKVDPHARTEDGPIPEQAAKAVAAMRQVFPAMVFDLVEEVPYIDSATQTMVMVWYEVEFFVDGVKHEFNATPDGVVIAYKKSIARGELPKAVADALAKAIPNGKIEDVALSETRARPRFVALQDPVVVYAIEPNGEGGAPAVAVKLRPDGTEVKEPELPDWAKQPSKPAK